MSIRLEVASLRIDGSYIYVGGMDLSRVLAASLPHLDDLKYEGAKDLSGARFVVTVDVEL